MHMSSTPNANAYLSFLFELAQLREIPRSGWSIIGVSEKETVAAHSLRTAVIAYMLAHEEHDPSPERVGMMALLHDVTECRSQDLHKIAQRYVTVDEEAIARDQFMPLGDVGSHMQDLWSEYHDRKTLASRIVKDADRLEVAMTAREYMTRGYPAAEDWYHNAGRSLDTKTAQELWILLGTLDPDQWWRGLKKFS